VNACTTVNIEVSCPTSCVEPVLGNGGTTDPTSASYPRGWDGISESSWGKRKRVVKFDQKVQRGSYIRITTCQNSDACSCVNCGLGPKLIDTDVDTPLYPDANKLLKFEVNGEGLLGLLSATLAVTTVGTAHRNGCVYVGLQDRTITSITGCASYGVDGFESIDQIPQGAEILVGPIGARAF